MTLPSIEDSLKRKEKSQTFTIMHKEKCKYLIIYARTYTQLNNSICNVCIYNIYMSVSKYSQMDIALNIKNILYIIGSGCVQNLLFSFFSLFGYNSIFYLSSKFKNLTTI